MGFYDTYLCEECVSPKLGKGWLQLRNLRQKPNSRQCDTEHGLVLCLFFSNNMCVLFFVVIAVVVFQGSMIALGDFSAYNNTEVFLCDNPSLFPIVNFHDSTKGSGQAEL